MAEFAPIDPATLNALSRHPADIVRLKRGIEKESLRITTDGQLSTRPHPAALGSALTHPFITTDFSEAQLELITGVHDDAESCVESLANTHRFVYENLNDELLWTASMPCILGDADSIPVGQYGTSNIAQAKTVYRLGLGNRYGRLMQTISGIHYNFSLPEALWPAIAAARDAEPDREFITRSYFSLIRNFRRHSWLLIYLFGASPAVCKSFVKNQQHGLEMFDEGSLYLPGATSLRMGGLGYQSDAQSSLHISYNDLSDYSETMVEALTRSYPPYERLGVRDDRGGYRQLNTAMLQIENEFYGTIRPKRPIRPGERPITALRDRGVEYVEVRCLDVNPFLYVGIDCPQIRFLDTFLMYCLLSDSPPDSRMESQQMQDNQLAVVERGRAPDLTLTANERPLSRDAWGAEILDGCQQVATLLDEAHGNDAHCAAVEQQRLRLADPELTPSARMLATMRDQKMPFFRLAINQSIAHKGYFTEHPLTERERGRYQSLTNESLTRQQEIEAADTEDFETFLTRYLAFG